MIRMCDIHSQYLQGTYTCTAVCVTISVRGTKMVGNDCVGVLLPICCHVNGSHPRLGIELVQMVECEVGCLVECGCGL